MSVFRANKCFPNHPNSSTVESQEISSSISSSQCNDMKQITPTFLHRAANPAAVNTLMPPHASQGGSTPTAPSSWPLFGWVFSGSPMPVLLPEGILGPTHVSILQALPKFHFPLSSPHLQAVVVLLCCEKTLFLMQYTHGVPSHVLLSHCIKNHSCSVPCFWDSSMCHTHQ
jgi:hypothetical protein